MFLEVIKVYEKFANLLSERGVTAYRVSKIRVLRRTHSRIGRMVVATEVRQALILAKYFDVPVEQFRGNKIGDYLGVAIEDPLE